MYISVRAKFHEYVDGFRGHSKKDIPFVFVIKQHKWVQKTVSPPFSFGGERNLATRGGGSSLQC